MKKIGWKKCIFCAFLVDFLKTVRKIIEKMKKLICRTIHLYWNEGSSYFVFHLLKTSKNDVLRLFLYFFNQNAPKNAWKSWKGLGRNFYARNFDIHTSFCCVLRGKPHFRHYTNSCFSEIWKSDIVEFSPFLAKYGHKNHSSSLVQLFLWHLYRKFAPPYLVLLFSN